MRWLRRIWNTVRPDGVERDIEREVAFHLAERADALRSEGLSEQEARRRARLQFGNTTLQAERVRDVHIALTLDAFLRDLRYAIRSLRRTPGFTATVVLTLALAIGANSAVFSVVDAVLLRPLPFPDGDRLMELRQVQEGTAESLIAPPRLQDWDALNTTFSAISGYYTEDVSEVSGDFPERLKRAWVAPRFFDVWGIHPAIGRGFSPREHRMGGSPAIVVSHRYWRDRLGSDPNPLGRTVRIGNAAVPIVGVMPQTFLFPDREVDLWSPLPTDNEFALSRRATWFIGIGRLKPGVSVDQAQANLAAVQTQLGRQHHDDARIGVTVTPMKERAVGGVRRSLWLVFGGVSVLLLITCTNIAALLLSRAAQRQQELSIRVSLGASGLAVAVQALIETLVLSVAGSLLGLLVAAGGLAALRRAAVDLPRAEEIAIDWRVALYTLATAVCVAVLCAVLPATRAARDRSPAGLYGAGRAIVPARTGLQWWLVGAQLALAVTLLAGAGLLLRSFQELWRVDPGFNASHVLAFRVSGNWAETVDQGRLRQRIDGTLERLRAIPGVSAAASSGWSLPGIPSRWETTFGLAQARTDSERHIVAEARAVSPEYFETMQIPILAGELCRRSPTGSGEGRPFIEVLVNRAFAARYLGAWASPLGLELTQEAGPGIRQRIVGVVGDAREQGLDREPVPMVYWCDSAPNPTPYFVVRTQTAPETMVPTIRAAMKELDPVRAVYEIGSLEDRIGGAFAENRLRAALITVFSLGAVLLSCLGIYGTLSYAVSTRRRELGVRLALGAARIGVVRQLLVESWRVVIVACLAGLALTAAWSRLLAGMLYGVSPSDPVTLTGVTILVVIVATLAAAIPAARAARVDPAEVLREG